MTAALAHPWRFIATFLAASVALHKLGDLLTTTD